MVNGKKTASPILSAIEAAEAGTTGEIRVHLSRRWIEPDPYQRALQLFLHFGMARTPLRNAVLIYVNLRQRKYAILGDVGFNHAVEHHYWQQLGRDLQENLRSTQSEKAIALTVTAIGQTLKKLFPIIQD